MDESLDLQFGASVDLKSTKYRMLQKLGEGGTAETYLVLASSGDLRGQLFAFKLFRRLSKPELICFNRSGTTPPESQGTNYLRHLKTVKFVASSPG